MGSYISKENFDILVQNSMRKASVSEKEATGAVMRIINERSITIGIPLSEKIKCEQVRAGEQAVVDNLKVKGLV
jgi:hypothetical protein